MARVIWNARRVLPVLQSVLYFDLEDLLLSLFAGITFGLGQQLQAFVGGLDCILIILHLEINLRNNLVANEGI